MLATKETDWGELKMDTHHTINIPVEVLGLSDIAIESVNFNADREIIIRAISTRQELLCRHCHRPTEPHGRGRELMLRHLPVFGKPTYIVLTPRPGICKYCDNHPTTTECLDWYEANSKYGFVKIGYLYRYFWC
jgi:transposase